MPRVITASSINAHGTFYWRISGKPVVYDKWRMLITFQAEKGHFQWRQ